MRGRARQLPCPLTCCRAAVAPRCKQPAWAGRSWPQPAPRRSSASWERPRTCSSRARSPGLTLRGVASCTASCPSSAASSGEWRSRRRRAPGTCCCPGQRRLPAGGCRWRRRRCACWWRWPRVTRSPSRLPCNSCLLLAGTPGRHHGRCCGPLCRRGRAGIGGQTRLLRLSSCRRCQRLARACRLPCWRGCPCGTKCCCWRACSQAAALARRRQQWPLPSKPTTERRQQQRRTARPRSCGAARCSVGRCRWRPRRWSAACPAPRLGCGTRRAHGLCAYPLEWAPGPAGAAIHPARVHTPLRFPALCSLPCAGQPPCHSPLVLSLPAGRLPGDSRVSQRSNGAGGGRDGGAPRVPAPVDAAAGAGGDGARRGRPPGRDGPSGGGGGSPWAAPACPLGAAVAAAAVAGGTAAVEPPDVACTAPPPLDAAIGALPRLLCSCRLLLLPCRPLLLLCRTRTAVWLHA